MISQKQRIHLMADCWKPACKAQGWKVSDRDFRLAKFSEILERPLATSDDIEPIKEFGILKHELLRLADNLKGAMESGHPELDERRRLLDVIADLFKCARVYDPADSYLKHVLMPRFKIVDGWRALEDLSPEPTLRKNWKTGKMEEGPSELMQCVFTISRCVNKLRNDADDTGHEMCVKARVRCRCADCVRFGQPHLSAGARPQEEIDETVPEDAELAPCTEEEPF
jgi:hypothetical protein